MSARSMRAVAIAIAASAILSGACDNALTGNLKPVPPVHRMPVDVEKSVILIAEDPIIESKDPVHISRAKENGIPRDYRASMETALKLAGFKIVGSSSERHDIVAKLALAVREEKGKVFQTYRCDLRAPDGTEVAQIDWAWPQGLFVDTNDVFDYATHNLSTEVAQSRPVIAFLRASRGAAPPTRPIADAGSD